MKTALLIVVGLTAAGCGDKSKPATTTTAQSATQSEHGKMSPEVTKFHDALSPRWHADKGEQRMKDTCAAVVELQTDAEALAKATPPTGADATKWSNGTKELTEAVVALEATCKSKDATAFEQAFHRVHEGFHAVMEVDMGGKPEEHGEHHEEHKHPM